MASKVILKFAGKKVVRKSTPLDFEHSAVRFGEDFEHCLGSYFGDSFQDSLTAHLAGLLAFAAFVDDEVDGGLSCLSNEERELFVTAAKCASTSTRLQDEYPVIIARILEASKADSAT